MTSSVLLPRLYPFYNGLLSRLRPPGGLADLAETVEEVCPAETSYVPPIIMLEGDWDNITAFQLETTERAERLRIFGGERQHAATMRYTFRDVLATPHGCFTAGKSIYRHGALPHRDILTGPIAQFDRGFYALSPILTKYFGHWVHDGLSTTLLARDDERLYFDAPPNWPHAQGYLDRLGLGQIPYRLAHFDRLTVSEDVGQNSNRAARRRQIQARMQEILPPRSAPGVFIRRGATGAARILLNEDEIANLLAARGFNICSAQDDLDTILAACAGVDLVVNMDGSHWAHATFAAALGALHVTLSPADRFNGLNAEYVTALNQRFATLVVPQSGAGYLADADRLLRLIDLGQEEMARG